MSLSIDYLEEEIHRNKEIHVISLEQIIGKHIKVSEIGEEGFMKQFLALSSIMPEKFLLHRDNFSVYAPNSSNITRSANGKSAWFLIRGVKGVHKQINMLFLGSTLWGLEISTGQQMRKSIERFGKDKIAEHLYKQVISMLKNPDDWKEIHGYCLSH